MISSDERSIQILYNWKIEQTALHVEVTCAGGELVFSGRGMVSDLDENSLVIGAGASPRGLRPGLWDLTLCFPPDGVTATFGGLHPISSDSVVKIESKLVKCVLRGREF
jgi:hypothetical protein